jgi:hypothetical protein
MEGKAKKEMPANILDFSSPGWADYYAEAVEYIRNLSKDEKKLAEVDAVVRKLGLCGLWKGYYPALYEVAKLLEKKEG